MWSHSVQHTFRHLRSILKDLCSVSSCCVAPAISFALMKVRDLRLARDKDHDPCKSRMPPRQKSFTDLLSTRQYLLQLLAKLSKMAYPRSVLHTLCGFLLLLACTEALKFDLQGFPYRNHKSERCIRNFVSKDTLVVVTATIGGTKGDGMVVNMHVSAIGHVNS
jgi:hypothetical protein